MNRSIMFESEAVVFYKDDPLAVLHMKPAAIELMASLEWKDTLFQKLNEIQEDPAITALLFLNERNAFADERLQRAARKRYHALKDTGSGTGATREEQELRLARELNMLSQYILLAARFRKLLIAGLYGEVACPFIGLSLVADLRIASSDMWFNLAPIHDSAMPGGGLTFFLPQYIGRGRMVEMLIARERVSATEAHELGLVTEVLPDKDFPDAAIMYARRLAVNADGIMARLRPLIAPDSEQLERFLTEEIRLQRSCLHERILRDEKEMDRH